MVNMLLTMEIVPYDYCLCMSYVVYITRKVDSSYGRFHPRGELTVIELENFWFALKPIDMWIYFQNVPVFSCMCKFF